MECLQSRPAAGHLAEPILQHLLYIASSGGVPDVAPNTCAGTSFNAGTLAFANALTAGQRDAAW